MPMGDPNDQTEQVAWDEKLPDGLWLEVIGQLKAHQRHALRQTCKRLRELVNSAIQELKVDPSGHGPVSKWHVSARFSRATSITISKAGAFDKLSDAAMASWAFAELSQLKLLRSLNLENCTRLSAAGLSALALACPHLHTLKLPPVRNSSDATLFAVLPHLPHLSSLALKTSDVAFAPHVASLTHLTALELECDTNGHAAKELRQLGHLTSLKSVIVWPSQDTFDLLGPHNLVVSVMELLADNIPFLPSELREQLLAVTDMARHKRDVLQCATGLSSLTYLDIQRLSLSCRELTQLSVLTALESLGVGDMALDPATPPPPLSSVTKLVTHTCQGMALLPLWFPSLKALSCDAANATLRDISRLTSLQHLLLWQPLCMPGAALGDVGLRHLTGLTLLRELRLEGADGLTDAGWAEACQSHSQLTCLHLTAIGGVTPVGLVTSFSHLPHLKHALLAAMADLVDEAVVAALLALPALEVLELEDCPRIMQAQVLSAMERMPRAVRGFGPDLTVLYRKGGALRRLRWP